MFCVWFIRLFFCFVYRRLESSYFSAFLLSELERMSTPVLLIVHRAVARCLYSYFVDLPPAEIPHLDVPLHTVIKLEPKAYGCKVTTFKLGVPNCEDRDSEK